MRTSQRLLVIGLLAATSCTPAEKPPVAPTPRAPAPKVETPSEVKPPVVYYRLVQTGHVELVVEEVRLDGTDSRCFQAQQRLLGGFTFDRGKGGVEQKPFAKEIEAIVASYKQWATKAQKPMLVLHGHADRDEADAAEAARALSRERAEAVKAWLVARGVPESRLKIAAHGWDLSPPSLEPNNALRPNRRVEISADETPPSHAKLARGKAVDQAVLQALQQQMRALEGEPAPLFLSLHAPRVDFVVSDSSGKLDLVFDITAGPPEAVALHRYFMNGLSNGCTFEAP